MVDFNAARVFFEGFASDSSFGDLPISYENVRGSIILESAKKKKEPWVRVSVVQGAGERTEIGLVATRRFAGICYYSFFVGLETGTGVLRSFFNNVSAAVVAATFPSGLRLLTPVGTVLGEDGDWFAGSLSCPFVLDQRF